jgi:heme-degrading monooxygenase HmoA
VSLTAFEMVFTGGTTDQYDEVIAKMGFEPGGKGAPGALFHWVSKTDDGLKVVDVWESPEEFQAFADSQIGPLTHEAGLNPPDVTAYPVHNHLVGPGL